MDETLVFALEIVGDAMAQLEAFEIKWDELAAKADQTMRINTVQEGGAVGDASAGEAMASRTSMEAQATANLTSTMEAGATSAAALESAENKVATAHQTAANAASAASNATDGHSKAMGTLAKSGAVVMAAEAGVIGVTVDLASKYQTATTALVTGAGESEDNIAMVRQGMLDLSTQVGVTANDLAKGMYMVESAGYHGADGLKVLKAAAEGARVGQADMGTVSDAVTTILTDYHMKASDAATVTSQMVTAVAAGKMHMSDFAGSLSAVLPVAAATGLGFDQVAGAIATMTAQGVSAQQSSQDLANVIRGLQAPSETAISEMEQMGLNAADISTKLGKVGLQGTIDDLAEAVGNHMGPAGTVLVGTLKESVSAGADAKQMLASMPADIQKLAASYQTGNMTQKEFRHEMMQLPVSVRPMLQQFDALVNKSRGFSDTLKSGSPDAQTFAAALSKMMGGATGLNVALDLTGANLSTSLDNIKKVGSATTDAQGNVKGWADSQKDLSTQLDQAKASLESVAIQIGNSLIPIVAVLAKDITGVVKPILDWIKAHQNLIPVILGVVAALAGMMIIAKIISAVKELSSVFSLIAANPWVLLVIAIAVAAVMIITHFNQIRGAIEGFINRLVAIFSPLITFFKQIFTGIVNVVTQAVSVIGSIIKTIFDVVSAVLTPVIQIFKLAFDIVSVYVQVWFFVVSHVIMAIVDVVRSVMGPIISIFSAIFGTAFNVIKAVMGPVVGFFGGIVAGIASVFGGIVSVVGGIIHGVVGTVEGIINGIIDAINFIIGIIDAVQVHIHFGPVNMDWDGLKLPKIPTLDTGGIVTGPTLAMLSMNSVPEAVVPLDGKHGAGGGGTVLQVNMAGAYLMSDHAMDDFIDKLGARFSQFTATGAGITIARR